MIDIDRIDSAVDFAEKNGFNHIFAQVRGRGDSFYNSDFVPKSKLIKPNLDPLNYLLTICKNKNIKVHAWLNIYYLWSSKNKPKNKDHLFFQKPNWIDHRKTDNYIINKNYLKNNLSHNIDGEGYFLAPTNLEVNKYLINVISELCNKYDVDGVHYDYIRYHSSEYGYNREGIIEFSRKNIYYNNDDLYNEELSYFKRMSITNFVKKANNVIKNKKSDIIISAAVKPNIYNAKLFFGQEWDLWLSAGYLDWAVPMNYLTDYNDFIQNIYVIKDNLPQKFHKNIIVGISTYNQSANAAGRKISKLREMNFNNISLFSYNTISNKPKYWKRLKKYF